MSAMTLAMGQNGRYTFSGTAGASMGLQIGGLTTTPSGKAVGLTVLKPDGTTLATGTTNGGFGFNLANLPATGTYTLFVDPQSGVPATITANLVDSASAAVAVDGSSGAISTMSMPGSYGYFTFTATQGENIGLGIRDLVVGNTSGDSIQVFVYKPDGTQLASNASCRVYYGGCDFNLSNVSQTGIYVVLATPYNPNIDPRQTMSFTVNVTHDLVVSLPTGTQTSMLAQTSPDTGGTVNTYDDAGNLLSRKDAKNQTTTYTYDVLNRRTLVTYADSSNVAYTYDQGANGIGRLTGMPMERGTHHFLNKSGLDQASNTSRAGASNVRVTTTSRSDFFCTVVRGDSLSFLAATGLLLSFEFVDDAVQCFEARVPHLAVARDPRHLLLEAARADATRAYAADLLGGDEAGQLEHADVLLHGRGLQDRGRWPRHRQRRRRSKATLRALLRTHDQFRRQS